MTLTPQDQQAIVDAHNAYRTDPTINAPALKWSSDLASGAQSWADNLATNVHKLVHSDWSIRPDLGENIAAASPGSHTVTQLVDQWGGEKANFKPGTFPDISKTGNWADAGHYSQVIWNDTTEVGCGLASDDRWDYLVCRYQPAGNMEGVQVPQAAATNLALSATATASSENTSTSQTANKAIDGVIGGYNERTTGNYTQEWATVGGGAGSWLKLTWSSSQSVSRIVLYDRPNSDDQITGGTLQFSDGSSIDVGTLNNDGSAKTLTFSGRSITSLQLNITSVSSTTKNVGLSEIEVYAS